jgi:integrase
MSVHKRKYRNGRIVWRYRFDAPGASRLDRRFVEKDGFATKKAASDAETIRRAEVLRQYEMEKSGAGAPVVAQTTLGALLHEFIDKYGAEKLAPKTVERYRNEMSYIDPELLKLPLEEITPRRLNCEWERLLASGGRTRTTKTPRPLSPATVRNITTTISSAFLRAIKLGMVSVNPVKNSDRPIPKAHQGIALTVAQEDLLINAARGAWCLATILKLAAATGCRRSEMLALRWSDIVDGRASITRSLSQTKDGLFFKCPKTPKSNRVVGLPAETLAMLKEHRKRQDEFRLQFGADYRSDLDLIIAQPDGEPFRPNTISAEVSMLFKRLKIPKPKGSSLHIFRHTHGSQMLANGVPLPVVSERLGHSSIAVTANIYSHAIHGQDDEAVKKWEEYQRKNRPAAGLDQQRQVQ